MVEPPTDSYAITHVGSLLARPEGDEVPHFCSTRYGTSPNANPKANPNSNPHPQANPNPHPHPNPNPNPNANVRRLCSARYGTSEDNPAEPSEMNAEGIVRDQGLSFEFRDSNMMKVTQALDP